MKSRWSGLFVVSVLVACGSPKVGDPCTTFTCLDKTRALECRNGIYADIPCPGPDGCFTQSTSDTLIFECDIRGLKSGDGCAEVWAQDVACLSNTDAFICNGTLWSRQPCKSCKSFVQGPNAEPLDRGTCE